MIKSETLALFEQYPGVLAFAEAMMYKIEKNKNKVDPPGKPNPWPRGPNGEGRLWDPEYVSFDFLTQKLREERLEFNEEILHAELLGTATDNLLMEAADEANILMMICDNVGLLKGK